MFGSTVGFSGSADRMALSSVRDVLFGRKGNGLGIYSYLRMSGVVALESLLVQVTHTESGPTSEVGGQGHWTLGGTGEIQSNEWSGSRGARCVHMWVPPACMTRDNWACSRGMEKVWEVCEGHGHWLVVNITAAIFKNKKLSYCWETVRRKSMPRIAEMDVKMTN